MLFTHNSFSSKKKYRKGQTSTEFMIVIVGLSLIFAIAIGIYGIRIRDINMVKENANANNIAKDIGYAINDVYLSESNSTRIISISRLLNKDKKYDIVLSPNNNVIELVWDQGYASYPLITSAVSIEPYCHASNLTIVKNGLDVEVSHCAEGHGCIADACYEDLKENIILKESVSFLQNIYGVVCGAGGCPSFSSQDQAISFDGTNRLLSTQNINLENSFTYFSWFKVDSFLTNGSVLSNLNTSGQGYGLSLIPKSGEIELKFVNSTNSFESQSIVASNIVEDQWVNVAVVYEASNLTVYVDGLPLGSINKKIKQSNSKFNIGQWNVGQESSGFFNGSIRQVAIFDRALFPSEIYGLYLHEVS